MADLIYEVKDHLARITMNRPEHLNCFSEEMIRLWTAALEDIRIGMIFMQFSFPETVRHSAQAAMLKPWPQGTVSLKAMMILPPLLSHGKIHSGREFSVFRSFWRKLISR